VKPTLPSATYLPLDPGPQLESNAMTHDTRASKFLAALFATVAIVAACSSSGGGASTAPSVAAPSASASEAAPSASEPAPSESASASAAAGIELKLATGALGTFLTDGAGKTLYMFTPDEDQAAPTCNDACAAKWPALTASAASDVTVGDGLDQSKIKVVDRTDGTKQVVYGEYPLYYFADDSAAGQTNGQGLNSKWYVVGGDGEPIKS
jgi:predicted lipoprotein with Yx(FWY)xxD motif